MPIYQLPPEIWFPKSDEFEGDLVAIGGDFLPSRLLAAYQNGIFPWGKYDGIVHWYSPQKRMVLRPSEVKISKSSRNLINQKRFDIMIDTDFEGVLEGCQNTPRKGQDGTWLTDDLKYAILDLHRRGYAHSYEAYLDWELVGGLYGFIINGTFSGDSMFSTVSNASKMAFIEMCDHLGGLGMELIDCQSYTKHLASLGAYEIPRGEFLEILHNSKFP